ncbi:glycosyltransferase family 4 protein [Acinetobacter variabilis]|uniref:glycosyltransferase family 4 protein n=1 Tax=Acinetobacter variabilis TaxID=70346 RepID=UPI00376F8B1F
MENHILLLTLEQKRQGKQVVLAYNQGNSIDKKDQVVIPWLNLRKIRPQFLRDSIFYCCLLWSMACKSRKYDVIHIHGAWSAFIWGNIIANVSKSTVRVASIHGSLKTSVFWQKIYSWCLKPYQIVYCTGSAEAKFLLSIGLKQARWQSSGIRPHFIKTNLSIEKQYDVITVGSLVPVKNFDLFLDTAKLVKNYRFAIVGVGPLEKALKTRCHQESINNVFFLGRLDAENLSKALMASKVFLSTSISEGTPTAILEAMATGRPIISTPSNDYTNLIKQKVNGFIVDYSADIIADTLRKLLEDPVEYELMSVTNKQQAQIFGWENVAQTISSWIDTKISEYENAKK